MTNPFDEIAERLSRIENRLIELAENRKDSGDQPSAMIWFNLDQLCNYLPDKPAKATVYTWVHKSKIPHHKGEGEKKLRFLKSDIDAWLELGRKKTMDEINIEVNQYFK